MNSAGITERLVNSYGGHRRRPGHINVMVSYRRGISILHRGSGGHRFTADTAMKSRVMTQLVAMRPARR